MEKLSSLFGRLALTVAGALALGACSRAEYAMLPPSASYLGTKPAAYAPRPAASTPVATAPAPAAPATAPIAAEGVVATPAAPVAAPTRSVAPVPATVAAQPAPATAPTPEATATTPGQPKLNLAQRLLLSKMAHKIDRQAQKMSARRGDNTASTTRIDGKLRYAIIFGVISIIFFAIGGGVGNLIGTILLVIGILFLLFWLLDNL